MSGEKHSAMEEGDDNDAASSGVASDDAEQHQEYYWTVCSYCKGEGRIIRAPSRKARRLMQNDKKRARTCSPIYTNDSRQYKEQETDSNNRSPSTIHRSSCSDPCPQCQGSGLTQSTTREGPQRPNPALPTLAIVGGGLAGLALAAACRHRGIPYAVFERDNDFQHRKQGYGLTMQQASKALRSLGIPSRPSLPDGITSTKHIVHKSDGSIVGQWGLRHWQSKKVEQQQQQQPQQEEEEVVEQPFHGKTNAEQQQQPQPSRQSNESKRQNVHIARQALRHHLLVAAGSEHIYWGHRLVHYQQYADHVSLTFQVRLPPVAGQQQPPEMEYEKEYRADYVVGADGIRSQVRRQLIGDAVTPLRYLDCIVILGICPLDSIPQPDRHHELLDGATVFQTADGTTRIYVMPYSTTQCMWQLSFPMTETEASALSRGGPRVLKEEAIQRCYGWHDPLPKILVATPEELISGYPVYDRELLSREHLLRSSSSSLLSLHANSTSGNNSHHQRRVTLMGDAAHPMSPFKGQGANQALLDALSLARAIYRRLRWNKKTQKDRNDHDDNDHEHDDGVVDHDTMRSVLPDDWLTEYEEEMLARSAVKVQASAEAARFLHTAVAIQEGDVTRGGAASKNKASYDS